MDKLTFENLKQAHEKSEAAVRPIMELLWQIEALEKMLKIMDGGSFHSVEVRVNSEIGEQLNVYFTERNPYGFSTPSIKRSMTIALHQHLANLRYRFAEL